MANRSYIALWGLAALASLVFGCGDEATTGEIGNGSFGYRCISDRDPACAADDNFANTYLKAIPGAIALGASFGVGFLAASSSALDGTATVASVSPEALLGGTGVDPTFTAMKPGFAGIVARRGSSVVDVLHVHVAPIAKLQIDASFEASGSGMPGISTLEIGTGALVTLSALPMSESGAVLVGSLDDAWTTDDSAIAEIMTSPATDSITVRAGDPGEAAIRATIGGTSASVLFKVVNPMSGSGGAGGVGTPMGTGGAGGAGGAP